MNNFLILIVLVTQFSFAQSLKEREYQAYLSGSKTFWKKCISLSKEKNGENSFAYAMTIYGMLGNTMATSDKATFEEYDDVALDILKELKSENPKSGNERAIMSSIYGMTIGHTPMMGMFYGNKSGNLASRALKLQPESAIVQKMYGASKYYTPKAFGGNVKLAIKHLKKAVSIYEAEGTEYNWMYLGTLVELANAYKKNQEFEMYKNTLDKAIKFEPNFQWAKSLRSKIN